MCRSYERIYRFDLTRIFVYGSGKDHSFLFLA